MVFWLHRSLVRDSSDLHGVTNCVTLLFTITLNLQFILQGLHIHMATISVRNVILWVTKAKEF
jgi:hypothetical protein